LIHFYKRRFSSIKTATISFDLVMLTFPGQ